MLNTDIILYVYPYVGALIMTVDKLPVMLEALLHSRANASLHGTFIGGNLYSRVTIRFISDTNDSAMDYQPAVYRKAPDSRLPRDRRKAY